MGHAIKIKPDYVNAVLHLAEAEKGHHKYREAADAFTKALRLSMPQEKRVKISETLSECERLAEAQEKELEKKETARKEREEAKAKASVEMNESGKREQLIQVNEVTVNDPVQLGEDEEETSEASFNEPPEQKEEILDDKPPCCSKEGCTKFWNVGNIANAISAVIMIIGIVMLATTGRTRGTLIVFNLGIFAFSGGATNGIAIKMLFDKIPGFAGSGVIPSRFVEIRKL